MIVLNCNSICLSYGAVKILDDVSFNLHEADKVGVVGVNGAGKSTLFKILCGKIKPDSGSVSMAKNVGIGCLEQNSGLDSSNSILEEVLSVFRPLIEMETAMRSLETSIESAATGSDNLHGLAKEYADLQERYARGGGYEYGSRARGVLRGLGFKEDEFGRNVGSLSGGQKTRLALSRLLMEEPDILLLDEPTNHLDIEALEWFEEYLKNYRKSIMIISHDRYFLDSVTNRTIEIENRKSKAYAGNYSSFVLQKAEDREAMQKRYSLQQKEIERMEAFIEQQRRWNREKNIVAAESRQKAVDRMEKAERPGPPPGKVRMKFISGIASGNDVLTVKSLAKEYPGKPLFRNASFGLRKGERAFILGPNGCGKSTLLKILAGRLESASGSYGYGHNVNVGYYDQELSGLKEDNMVLEEVWSVNGQLTQTMLRNTLAAFLFKGEDVMKLISSLSGGERSRVELCKLMLSGSNLLLLDEPTNHLDIDSREILENALLGFDGTILAVSHDRYFIRKLSTRVMEFYGTDIIDYKGGYDFYRDSRDETYKRRRDNEEAASAERATASKLEYMGVKEEKSRQRKHEKQLADTEREISEIEKRLAEIDTDMAGDGTSSDHVLLMELNSEYASLKDRLDALYLQWEELMGG